ncbi:hypothetical protein HY990_02040 [Candidatus Micrarchaeota archaeon]|nr:hypothetical protein [Candidatus Micrarchaeota archaeon]
MPVLTKINSWEKLLFGVPLLLLFLAIAIHLLLSIAFFWPSISGHSLIGTEDIRLFIWTFWHFETSFSKGSNVFFAPEIFAPIGISLSQTPLFPFQSLLYLILPSFLGVIGKITILQILSFFLTGPISFILVYKFSRSFLPSLAGSFIINFSAFHFEKAIHHLNYAMSLPFILLFFYHYYDALDSGFSRKKLVFLALSLLFVSLNEVTASIMLGFFIFLDILFRYVSASKKPISTLKNFGWFFISLFAGLFLYEFLISTSLPFWLAFIIPPLPFLFVSLFLILGFDDLLKRELSLRYFLFIGLISIPSIFYISFLLLQPAHSFHPSSILLTNIFYSTPYSYLVYPSSLQLISSFGIAPLASVSEGGLYLGILVFLFLFSSALSPASSQTEDYFRNFGLLSILISFPILPVQPLFPGLSLLRVPPRFILFATLFIGIFVAIFLKRLWDSKKVSSTLLLLIVLFLLFERLPNLNAFTFNQKVPAFYANLSESDPSSNASIFLYPNFNYFTLLNEVYYQTIHGKTLSYGVVSRPPTAGPDLYLFYNRQNSPSQVISFFRSYNYSYLVLQKTYCNDEKCYLGIMSPIPKENLGNITFTLDSALGDRIFEDDQIIVYSGK